MTSAGSGGFRKTSERLVHEGYIVSLFEAEFEGPGGEHISRDVIRHPGAVAVVAVDGDDYRLLSSSEFDEFWLNLAGTISADGVLDAGRQ